MNKIIGIYKITNTVTGDFYIGSSKDVKRRLAAHKWPSVWKNHPKSQLYQDMQKYGLDKFVFQILEEVEEDKLKEKEQQFIETLQPTYNDRNANGLNIERCKETKKEYNKEYRKSDKGKEYQKEYEKTDKCKEYRKQYRKSDKGKESYRKARKKYDNQLCCYNGEIVTLTALRCRFRRRGIEHPTAEAKKYLLNK